MALTPDQQPSEMDVVEIIYYNVECDNCGVCLGDDPYNYDAYEIRTAAEARDIAWDEGFRNVHGYPLCPDCIRTLDEEDLLR